MMDFVKTVLEDADILIYMLEIGEKQMKTNSSSKKLTAYPCYRID